MERLKEFPFTSPSASHPDRRFVIVRRADGHLTIVEEYHYQSADEDGRVYAEGWAPLPAYGLYASIAIAEQTVHELMGATR